MKLLAFDLGASSGKMFQGNYDGHSLALSQVSRFNNQPITIRGEMFWDVLEILRNLRDGISNALQCGGCITSIGLDSYSNDFGLLDENGRFVTQVHCYRDNRTKRNEDRIYSLLSKQRLHHLCGNQNALFGTVMQLASMVLEEQSYLLEGAGKLLLIPDLLSYFLTGEVHSEYTIASVSQLLDFRTGTWSPEILHAFGIPERILPAIVQPGTKIGRVAELPGIPAPAQLDVIAVCEHDTASAFLAAPYGDGSIIISSGTWSLVGVEVVTPIINDYTFAQNIANEGGYPGHHRLLKNVMGQWIIQECQRTYAENGTDYSIEKLIQLAEAERPFQFLINPDDERFFSPGEMPQKVADYCAEHGQERPDSIGQTILCVLESLALQYRMVIEQLEQATGRHFSKINITGGGSHNLFLNQAVANATGRIVVAGPDEATSLGNILVQLMVAGEVGSVTQGRELIKMSFPLQTFEPRRHDEWEERYQQYVIMMKPQE